MSLHPWHTWYDDEHTILQTTYPPTFTWDEYTEAGNAVWKMMNEVEHPVVHLSDYSAVTRLPPGAFAQLRRIAMLIDHRNFEHFVVYGLSGRLHRTISEVFASIYGHLTVADSLDDAIKAIEALRA